MVRIQIDTCLPHPIEVLRPGEMIEVSPGELLRGVFPDRRVGITIDVTRLDGPDGPEGPVPIVRS